MEENQYDVFVIGSGVAGQTVAEKCAKKGLKVAIADYRAFGGTCANRGCDPKKILLQFSDLIEHSKRLKKIGVSKLPKIDWKTIQKYKSNYVNAIPSSTEKKLKNLNIELYHQSPSFISQNEVKVEGKIVSAKYFVIATGKTPVNLKIDGREHLKTSDHILNLKKIPKSAILIGAGYVGVEFANMLAVLGCKVTLLQRSTEILSNFDQYLVKQLVERLKSLGVNIVFNASVQSVQKLKKNLLVDYIVDEECKQINARKVYNTAGRKPSIDGLNLEKVNVSYNSTGILVNDFLQSVNSKNIYACGDVSSLSLPLTPLSGLQGSIVANNILNSNIEKFDAPSIPSTVFTTPNLSSVGLSEDEAKSRYKNIKVYKGDASGWFNAKKSNEQLYAYKILVNERTGVIIGAHLLSCNANENINIFVTAIYHKMTVETFKKMIFTYPSYSNDLKSMFVD